MGVLTTIHTGFSIMVGWSGYDIYYRNVIGDCLEG